MVKDGLVNLLSQIAKNDLTAGSDIYDHPCSVAVRALDKCYDDIGILRKQVKRHSSQSKKVQTLIVMPYNPEW